MFKNHTFNVFMRVNGETRKAFLVKACLFENNFMVTKIHTVNSFILATILCWQILQMP